MTSPRIAGGFLFEEGTRQLSCYTHIWLKSHDFSPRRRELRFPKRDSQRKLTHNNELRRQIGEAAFYLLIFHLFYTVLVLLAWCVICLDSLVLSLESAHSVQLLATNL